MRGRALAGKSAGGGPGPPDRGQTETWLRARPACYRLIFVAEISERPIITMEKKTIITGDELPPGVLRAVEQGKKIEAIKLLREATGMGLANAKVLVDKASREHGPRNTPPRFVVEQAGLGKLLKMLLIIAIAFSVYRYVVPA